MTPRPSHDVPQPARPRVAIRAPCCRLIASIYVAGVPETSNRSAMRRRPKLEQRFSAARTSAEQSAQRAFERRDVAATAAGYAAGSSALRDRRTELIDIGRCYVEVRNPSATLQSVPDARAVAGSRALTHPLAAGLTDDAHLIAVTQDADLRVARIPRTVADLQSTCSV